MELLAQNIWHAAQENLRALLSPDTYKLWFAPLLAHGKDHNTLELEVANDFCEVWLKDNYAGLLHDVVARASGRPLEIQFKVGPGKPPARLAAPDAASSKEELTPRLSERTKPGPEMGFNPKNKFDTFVVGSTNNF